MKNRNLQLFLLITFLLICGYNLFYSWSRISTDYELNSLTPEQRSEWLKDPENTQDYRAAVERSMSLGLDLQGGMFVTLEVGVEAVVRTLAGNTTDTTFNRLLNQSRAEANRTGGRLVDIMVRRYEREFPKQNIAVFFSGDNNLGITYQTSNTVVAEKLNKEVDDAVKQTYNILRQRIDQFGVASPDIRLQTGTSRILIELPGVKDATRVRKLLGGTAKLEFWPTYALADAYPVLIRANDELKKIEGLLPDSTTTDSSRLAAADTSRAAADSTTALAQATDSAGADSAANANLSEEAQREKFKKENPLFRYLVLAINENTTQEEARRSPVVGYALPTDTSRVNALLTRPEVLRQFPNDMVLMWTAKPRDEGTEYLSLLAIKSNAKRVAPLTGESLTGAFQDYNQEKGGKDPIVIMTMDPEGAKKWKNLTKENLQKSIAVVLDGLVYTYPTVNSVIENGRSEITGNFTLEEARDLANLLKAGRLRAPARVQGEEIVGPTLGEATINQGLTSFALGFAMVIVFLVVYYRGSGLVAVVGILANLFMTLGVSSAFNITLTLPGIAGILLSLAMAVDANVLIYERTREELEAGKPFRSAINSGFKNALLAIVDGNVTTVITGIVLFVFGTGPIRGFAVTLIIGIATSMVSALVITRLILNYFSAKSDTATISFGLRSVTTFFQRAQLRVMDQRKLYFGITAAVILASLAAVAVLGLKGGTDFTGGRQYLVEFTGNPDPEVARQALTGPLGGSTPLVKTVSAKDQLLITTGYLMEDPGASQQVQDLLMQGLNGAMGTLSPNLIRSSVVGPSVAKDITEGAIYAVVLSLLAMFVYIFIRFRYWQMGVGAIVGLLFNVAFVLGLFALLGQVNPGFSVELDQAFIAAILTVIGYTINDTVVVFDRIRETMADDKQRRDLGTLFNRAVTDTLSRTVVTSTTTLISTVILFFLGGDVLKAFMLALFAGIVAGTFSSIFVAAPVSLELILRGQRRQTAAARVPERATA